MHRRTIASLVALTGLSLAACSSDEGTEGTDAGSITSGTDSGAPRPAADSGAPLVEDAGTPPEGEGSLMGVVTRSAMPMAGGRGHLYIAIFDRDPVLDRDGATVVANGLVMDADMSASGARIVYSVLGIPPRAEPYYVVAFLDDNGNADTSDPRRAGPDRGDLVSLMGLSSPQVTVSSATVVARDIDLNASLPF
ncbi:hypothetical protein [Sandaracinus amylolyticus]|uniref:hypothetical protein n=1 Tax=Sandaracinus amylolyticus TaxID=927083 RepID=UPI001F323594|nr:hypothetical protein [Sandaracinus amylolyticus]UJR81559.1 Hypothetical protein I5071_36190 [Sandaracinus amylolyticus]